MPKELLSDERYDFRGGRVTSVSPDLLNPNELVDATNARIDAVFGGVTKRSGTRRINSTATPAAITGVYQWDAPTGKQLVVIAGGILYYINNGLYGTLTGVTPPTSFSTSVPQVFAPFRQNTSGAPLYLYIGDNSVFYRWDGSALTKLTQAGNALDQAALLAAYHTRMFAKIPAFPKNAYWSQTGNAENFVTTGLPADGGTAMVETLEGDALVAMELVGTSLLLATADSVARFTGYSSQDISIAQDVQGISAEVGAVGPYALRRFEHMAVLLAHRGPYELNEYLFQPMGVKVQQDFASLDLLNISKAQVAVHRDRREIWFVVPGANDGGVPKTILAYSAALQTWMGPWSYSFGITCTARYVDANGYDQVVAGCSDGFVRIMDIGKLDDVRSDGTLGDNITMTIEGAPHFFSVGPRFYKSLDKVTLDADLDGSASFVVKVRSDDGSLTSFASPTPLSGLQPYRIDLSGYAKRPRLVFTDASSSAPALYGYTLDGWSTNRR